MLKSASTPGSEYRELFNRWAEANGYPFRMGEPIGHKRQDYTPPDKPENIKEVKVLGHRAIIRPRKAGKQWDALSHYEDTVQYISGQIADIMMLPPEAITDLKIHGKVKNKLIWRTLMEESNEKTQVHVNAEDGRLEIVHRHGAAAEIQEPKQVRISGSIETPLEYYLKRKEVIDQNAAHLEVDQTNGDIFLYCDPASPIGAQITGRMKMNPLLELMNINDFSGHTFGESDFIMLLKRTRSIFEDQADSLNLVDKIKNIEMRVEKEIDRKDDERGNRKDLFEQVCETDLPDGFMLHTNIFVASKEGTKEESFYVELKYHYKSQLLFWLESPALQELYEDRLEAMMGEQINGFNDEIPIIYV